MTVPDSAMTIYDKTITHPCHFNYLITWWSVLKHNNHNRVWWQKWYPVSKTLAEKAAWEFAEKNRLDVVAINPATCLGQLLQPGLNASCAVLQQLLQGSTDTQEYHWLGAVHVKDVAKAQILLFESPHASGRHLCTNGIYQFGDFAERVSKLYHEFPIHRFVVISFSSSFAPL